jgi:hypothetical protein
MNSPTMSGFAAWYIEWVLGLFCAGILLHWIWELAVKHGRRLESKEQLDSYDSFMSDGEEDIVVELEEMYNRPNLFDQDAE